MKKDEAEVKVEVEEVVSFGQVLDACGEILAMDRHGLARNRVDR